jgi:hypothetical protein
MKKLVSIKNIFLLIQGLFFGFVAQTTYAAAQDAFKYFGGPVIEGQIFTTVYDCGCEYSERIFMRDDTGNLWPLRDVVYLCAEHNHLGYQEQSLCHSFNFKKHSDLFSSKIGSVPRTDRVHEIIQMISHFEANNKLTATDEELIDFKADLSSKMLLLLAHEIIQIRVRCTENHPEYRVLFPNFYEIYGSGIQSVADTNAIAWAITWLRQDVYLYSPTKFLISEGTWCCTHHKSLSTDTIKGCDICLKKQTFLECFYEIKGRQEKDRQELVLRRLSKQESKFSCLKTNHLAWFVAAARKIQQIEGQHLLSVSGMGYPRHPLLRANDLEASWEELGENYDY